MKIAVLGAGAWGTALAIHFARQHRVVLWVRDAAQATAMGKARENERYLPGFRFPDPLALSGSLESALSEAELAIVATPLSGLRPTLKQVVGLCPGLPLIWVCKGFEAGTGLMPHQVVAELMGANAQCAALSGPSFAEEVARGLPAAVALASSDIRFASSLIQSLHGNRLRIYANDDLVGVEVGGAVKNVIAIACGICDGLGLGLNARAALITRGLAEMARLGEALGGRRGTFMGLAGVGDLILTCTGDLSRNRRVGLALSSGKTLERALAELGHTAEGVSSAREVDRLALRLGIEVPVTSAVNKILHAGLPVTDAVELLMARNPRNEGE